MSPEKAVPEIQPHAAGYPEGLVLAQSQLKPAVVVSFTEGPAVDAEGNVYFSDIIGNRILKLLTSGDLLVFREDAGRANGNAFDRLGRLVTCEGAEFGPGGRRRVTRTDVSTRQVTILTERYEGKRYNSPNDLAIDAYGTIYFTDPLYGGPDGREMDVEAVYRIDADSNERRILSQPEVQKPNGIAVSLDARTLYVVDSNPAPGGNRKVWAFTLDRQGSPANQRLVFDFGTGRGGDGMRLDVEGNLWVAAGINAHRGRPGETLDVPAGVYIISPEGRLLGRVPIPEDTVTNLAFGGPDRKTLYVTAGRNLYHLPVEVEGLVIQSPRGHV